jgi:hypothetical protein
MSRDDAAILRRAYEVWNESGPAAVTEQSDYLDRSQALEAVRL